MHQSQVRRLKTALYWKGDPARRQRIQMVLLREGGIHSPPLPRRWRVAEHGKPCPYSLRRVACSAQIQAEWRLKRQNMTLA